MNFGHLQSISYSDVKNPPMNPNTLHLLIPKTEPKPEPEDLPDPNPLPHRIRTIPKTLALLPPPPLQSSLRPLPLNPSDERHRLRLFLRSINPNHSPAATAQSKKSHCPRSADLQRVSGAPSPADAARIRDLVRRTRILYESTRIHYLRQEESDPLPAGRRSRADLKAATLMKDNALWLNRENRTVGVLPGVRVGDVSFYRMELCVLGLHGQVQAGIDFVTTSQGPTGEPIATSVIVSGLYEDDVDEGNVVVYTGHGGREVKNDTRHNVDQKLEGGNLALERSGHYGIEIRLIRGLDCERSPTRRVYVYDGLYQVVEWWRETGRSGFTVYKFKFVRLAGQETMGSTVIRSAEESKNGGGRRDGYLSGDISRGKEKMPVAVFNDVNGNQEPLMFDYIVRPTFKSFVMGATGGRGCRCDSDCGAGCECLRRNGGEKVYDENGRLLGGRPLVYECGRECGCPPSCQNRVGQKGLRHRLEVFMSKETEGWGVRSLDFILAGEFLCEFSGILLTKEEAALAPKNGARLVYPNRFPRRWEEWGDLSMVKPDYEKPKFPPVPDVGYAIDVSSARNVACYLSHSCNPNVFVQFVLFNHYNVEYPRLMVFALENIPPMRELSLDYGV